MLTEKRLNLLSSTQDFAVCLINCSNNGVCNFTNDKYVCKCFPGFIGDKCQTNTRPCSYYPCLNGICTDILDLNKTILKNQQVWDYFCNCSDDYYGRRCQTKINVCENETCSGNGLCFDNSSIPTCGCFKDFSGVQCEIRHPKLITIRKVITVSAAIAYLIIGLILLTLAIIDFTNIYFPKTKNIKLRKTVPNRYQTRPSQPKTCPTKTNRIKFTYVNQTNTNPTENSSMNQAKTSHTENSSMNQAKTSHTGKSSIQTRE